MGIEKVGKLICQVVKEKALVIMKKLGYPCGISPRWLIWLQTLTLSSSH